MSSWEITTIVSELRMVDLGLDLCYLRTLLREVSPFFLFISPVVLWPMVPWSSLKKLRGGEYYLRDMCCVEHRL